VGLYFEAQYSEIRYDNYKVELAGYLLAMIGKVKGMKHNPFLRPRCVFQSIIDFALPGAAAVVAQYGRDHASHALFLRS